MKKSITLMALLLCSGTAMYASTGYSMPQVQTAAYAATDNADATTVGEDNYLPNGEGFTWTADVDFQTQKIVATVDLTNCKNAKENVLSIGTDINNWFGAVPNGGTVHCYYTPTTKELQVSYISTNATLGVYTYTQYVSDVEGETTFDLSYQYGIRVNGKVAIDGAAFVNLYTFNSVNIGSMEGNTRSNATYKITRVVKTAFENEAEQSFTSAAKTWFDNSFTRYDEATVSAKRTSYSTYDITINGLEVNAGRIGDITIKDVQGTYVENGNEFVRLSLDDTGKAVLSNLGELATAQGLTDGAEIPMKVSSGYIWNGSLYLVCSGTLGDKTIAYTFDPDPAQKTIFIKKLATTFSNATQSYDSKTLEFYDYTDGFADITIKNIQFATAGDTDMGTLTLKEVPYTKDGADFVLDATGLKASLEDTPTIGLKDWTDISVTGKVSGENIYLEISGKTAGMDVQLVYGEPIAEAVVYTDKMVVSNDGTDETSEDAQLSVRNDGDGTYTISLFNIGGQEKLSFKANGTTSDDGVTTYTANEAEALMSGVWDGYTAYVTISDACSKGDKFYGDFYLDFGGYASSYGAAYAYFVTFGDDTEVSIATPNATQSVIEAIYNVNGMRMNKLQKGINIIRTTNGKTKKVMK